MGQVAVVERKAANDVREESLVVNGDDEYCGKENQYLAVNRLEFSDREHDCVVSGGVLPILIHED